MNRIKGIPESHYVFTDNGWELLSSITIDTVILTFVNKSIVWQKQDKFTKFDYSGLITETSIRPSVYASIEPLLDKENFASFTPDKSVTKFFTKGYSQPFKTRILTHKISSQELVKWEKGDGALLMLSFKIEGKACISNSEEYIIL